MEEIMKYAVLADTSEAKFKVLLDGVDEAEANREVERLRETNDPSASGMLKFLVVPSYEDCRMRVVSTDFNTTTTTAGSFDPPDPITADPVEEWQDWVKQYCAGLAKLKNCRMCDGMRYINLEVCAGAVRGSFCRCVIWQMLELEAVAEAKGWESLE